MSESTEIANAIYFLAAMVMRVGIAIYIAIFVHAIFRR